MGKPEGTTTRILRETMDLDLDAVNVKLIDAGEKAINDLTLRKRRAWITAKNMGKTKRTGMGLGAKKKKKRKSPAPATKPREGTFAAFVWRQPYNITVQQVMERAKRAKIPGGSTTQVHTVRNRYPKAWPTNASLNVVATPSALRAEDARMRAGRAAQGHSKIQEISQAMMVAPRENTPARTEFVLLVMSIGLDTAEAMLQEVRLTHQSLKEQALKSR